MNPWEVDPRVAELASDLEDARSEIEEHRKRLEQLELIIKTMAENAMQADRLTKVDAKHVLRCEHIPSAPGWLAEILLADQLIDSRWFDSRDAARKWFRREYGPKGQAVNR